MEVGGWVQDSRWALSKFILDFWIFFKLQSPLESISWTGPSQVSSKQFWYSFTAEYTEAN